MGFMETAKIHGVARPAGKHCSLEGAARLAFQDGRSVPVAAKLTLTRGFFWLSGGGHFTCGEEIAFDAINGQARLRLLFDGDADVEISVFEIRTNEKQTTCWYEVHA